MKNSPQTYLELEKKLKLAEEKIIELEKIVSKDHNNISPLEGQVEIPSNKLYKILADNSTDLVGILNLDLKFQYLSPSIKTLTGYSQEEGKRLNLNEFLSTESAEKVFEAHLVCMKEGGTPSCLDLEFIKKDGSSCMAEVISKPIFNKKGELYGIYAACRNITERVNLNNQLKTEREWTKLVFSNLNDRILVFDKGGKLVFSSYLPIWFHPDHPQFLKDPIFNPIHPEDMSTMVQALKDVFITGKGNRMDYRSKGDGEAYKWVEGNASVVQLPGSNESYLINVVRDIDIRKTLEKDLSDTIRTKDKLFSIIAHDLRSPFSALIGFSKKLDDDYEKLDENTRKKYIGFLSSSSQNAFKLLANLLDWSRIQTETIKINKVQLDLKEVINRCIAIYKNVAQLKLIKITTNQLALTNVYADPTTISTVIENLLNNAIKFSHSGGEIQVNIEDHISDVHLSIKDAGIGMDEKLMAMLFKIDKEVSRKGTNNEKGTGLGLVLCKEFIEINGGKIWVNSVVGEGSVFTISIPKEQDAACPTKM